jgi:hypothetical protein
VSEAAVGAAPATYRIRSAAPGWIRNRKNDGSGVLPSMWSRALSMTVARFAISERTLAGISRSSSSPRSSTAFSGSPVSAGMGSCWMRAMFRVKAVARVTTPWSASSPTLSISRGATPKTVAVARTSRARPIAGARSSRIRRRATRTDDIGLSSPGPGGRR